MITDNNNFAEWIGKTIGNLPGWLFWPILILIILVVGYLEIAANGPFLLSPKRRAYLGEKKNDRKKEDKKRN